MARPAPLWLDQPTRFAGIAKGRARLVLVLLALLLILCLSALLVPDPPAPTIRADTSIATDAALYEAIVAGIRHGGDYYTVAADALRAGSYPLRPFITFRMPLLATIQAALPDLAVTGLLYLLVLATGIAWAGRLFEVLPRTVPRITAFFMLAAGLLAFVQPTLAVFHESWAALLVALSLALRRPGRWIEAAAVALIALLIRETALIHVLVMALFAWAEGERREALGWGAVMLVFAVALGFHAWGVLTVTGPLDPASPGWAGLNGFGFFVKSAWLATGLQLSPLWLAAPLVGLALFGWIAWRSDLAARVAAMLALYAAAIGVFARLDNFYWGLMVAPVLLAGLVFVPDGVRDLVSPLLDRRRVRVHRVTR